MKKIGLALILLVGLWSCESDNSVKMGFKTTMKIKSVYDAGKVAKGEVIKAKFVVENTGDAPLVISDVKGSCSCTVADWTKDPIAPGESGYIKAQVNTENASVGRMSKTITLLTNTTPPETKIAVSAQIIK